MYVEIVVALSCYSPTLLLIVDLKCLILVSLIVSSTFMAVFFNARACVLICIHRLFLLSLVRQNEVMKIKLIPSV